MKKNLFTLLCLLLGFSPALRSEQPGPPPPENRGPGAFEKGMRNGEHPRPSPVMTYLEELQKEDPEAYQRMEQLRKEDPQAFRNELRKNAWGRRKEGRQIRYGDRPHPLQEEIDKVHNAENEEAREAAIAELRIKVSERVEKNLEEREEAIEKIRQKLKQLEEQNEQERIRREEIIDHHLQRILENLPPPPPLPVNE